MRGKAIRRGADHDRDEVVRERAQDPARHHPHHHRPVHPDEGQVGAHREDLAVRAQLLGADQHRVQAADEEEQPDAPEVLDADDLVVGAETEVARPAAGLLLPQGGRVAAQAGERVVEEAEADEEADDAADVGEADGQLVVVGVGEVADARPGDGVGAEPADVPAADAEQDAGEEVEAEQAAPQRRAAAGRRRRRSSGSPRRAGEDTSWRTARRPATRGLSMKGLIEA